jgi:hypothetical protein
LNHAELEPRADQAANSDKQIFEVEQDVANESVTVKNMIEGD